MQTPCTVAHQAPLSMGFPRQEYQSGLPFPSPGHLPDPGIEPASPTLAGGFFTAEPPRKPKVLLLLLLIKRQVFFFFFFLVVLSKNRQKHFEPGVTHFWTDFPNTGVISATDTKIESGTWSINCSLGCPYWGLGLLATTRSLEWPPWLVKGGWQHQRHFTWETVAS